jgi:hypothetical protein
MASVVAAGFRYGSNCRGSPRRPARRAGWDVQREPRIRIQLNLDIGIAVGMVIAMRPRTKQRGMDDAPRSQRGLMNTQRG